MFGPVVAHAELYGENRLNDDPDWPANITGATIPSELTYRYPVAYLGAQWKPAELFIGQLSREWGPRGVPGVPLSGWGYPYYHGAFNVGTRDIRLQGVVAQLEDWADTAGQVIHRYQVAHRLGVQVTPEDPPGALADGHHRGGGPEPDRQMDHAGRRDVPRKHAVIGRRGAVDVRGRRQDLS